MTCHEEVLKNTTFEIPPIVIHKVVSNGNTFRLIGDDLLGNELNFGDSGSWYYDIGKLFQVGDTVVKKKGEAIFRVYRKGERWQFKYICEKNERGEDIVRSENTRF